MTQTIKNIYQRINGVMKKVRYVQKGDKNIALKYSYVSHDAVMRALHDAVTEEGIVILPQVESYSCEGSVYTLKMHVDFINIDNPDDRVSMKYSIPSFVRNSLDEKCFGATYSYACKYALLKTFMLETGEDADQREEVEPCNKTINEQQLKVLFNMIGDDEARLARILEFNSVSSLDQIPLKNFHRVVEWISKNNSKQLKEKK